MVTAALFLILFGIVPDCYCDAAARVAERSSRPAMRVDNVAVRSTPAAREGASLQVLNLCVTLPWCSSCSSKHHHLVQRFADSNAARHAFAFGWGDALAAVARTVAPYDERELGASVMTTRKDRLGFAGTC